MVIIKLEDDKTTMINMLGEQYICKKCYTKNCNMDFCRISIEELLKSMIYVRDDFTGPINSMIKKTEYISLGNNAVDIANLDEQITTIDDIKVSLNNVSCSKKRYLTNDKHTDIIVDFDIYRLLVYFKNPKQITCDDVLELFCILLNYYYLNNDTLYLSTENKYLLYPIQNHFNNIQYNAKQLGVYKLDTGSIYVKVCSEQYINYFPHSLYIDNVKHIRNSNFKFHNFINNITVANNFHYKNLKSNKLLYIKKDVIEYCVNIREYVSRLKKQKSHLMKYITDYTDLRLNKIYIQSISKTDKLNINLYEFTIIKNKSITWTEILFLCNMMYSLESNLYVLMMKHMKIMFYKENTISNFGFVVIEQIFID